MYVIKELKAVESVLGVALMSGEEKEIGGTCIHKNLSKKQSQKDNKIERLWKDVERCGKTKRKKRKNYRETCKFNKKHIFKVK